jgi:hypothetical protein
MAVDMQALVAQLERHLAALGKPFEALEPVGDQSLRLRFVGPFEGRPIVWDATFMTLDAAYRQWLAEGHAPSPGAGLKQFIEIGAEGPEGRRLSVGLKLPAIDEPTVWKTLTMLRNYKRLRMGRHEWGTEPLFP